MSGRRSAPAWRTTFVDTSALLFVLLLLLWADRRPGMGREHEAMRLPGQVRAAAGEPEPPSKAAPLADRARAALREAPSGQAEIASRPGGIVAILRLAEPSGAIGADDVVALVTDRVRRLSRLGVVREIRLGQGISLPGTTLLLARTLADRFGDLRPPPTVLRDAADQRGPAFAIVLDAGP